MIHALYCNAINRETRPTAFFQEIPRQRQCHYQLCFSGENPGVLSESPSTDMDVFDSLVKFYYKKCFIAKFISNCMPVLLVHLSVYLSVSVSVSPSMVYDSMSSCKSKNVEKEVFTSDPLACLSIVQNQIKHRTPLQSSKFKAS